MAIITLKHPQYIEGFAIKAEIDYTVDGEAIFWVDAKQAALVAKAPDESSVDEWSLLFFEDEVEVIHP